MILSTQSADVQSIAIGSGLSRKGWILSNWKRMIENSLSETGQAALAMDLLC